MEIRKVAIIGSGTMGNGIAHVFAMSGYETYLIDINEDYLKRALSTIDKNMDRQIKKGTIKEKEKNDALSNIKTIVGVNNIPLDVDIIIEAINENKDMKREVFKEVDSRIGRETIFATNTSSISITELAGNIRPDKFIGMHFMNPVPVMPLVEIVRGYSTSEETYNITKSLAEKLGKVPVEVFDYPGFISNRILMPMINEAIFALFEGVASKESIDSIMKLGMNHPMGPLTLADFIGLDVCLNIMTVLYEGFNDPKYRPCPLLKKMVAANKLGRKTGEGFYKY